MTEDTVNITWDGTPYYAALVCSGTCAAPAAWTLHLVSEDGEQMTDELWRWPPSPLPISLAPRYDALALMGFAVVTGGVEAWTWNERVDEDGRSHLVAITPIRPLRADELTDTVTSALERFHA